MQGRRGWGIQPRAHLSNSPAQPSPAQPSPLHPPACVSASAPPQARRSWRLPDHHASQVMHFARSWQAWAAAHGGAAAVEPDTYLLQAEPFAEAFLACRGAMAAGGRPEGAYQVCSREGPGWGAGVCVGSEGSPSRVEGGGWQRVLGWLTCPNPHSAVGTRGACWCKSTPPPPPPHTRPPPQPSLPCVVGHTPMRHIHPPRACWCAWERPRG